LHVDDLRSRLEAAHGLCTVASFENLLLFFLLMWFFYIVH